MAPTKPKSADKSAPKKEEKRSQHPLQRAVLLGPVLRVLRRKLPRRLPVSQPKRKLLLKLLHLNLLRRKQPPAKLLPLLPRQRQQLPLNPLPRHLQLKLLRSLLLKEQLKNQLLVLKLLQAKLKFRQRLLSPSRRKMSRLSSRRE
ncbi:hypothetical protein NQ315_000054 [Exocentrus adspersus]|uniref:Uncharacterized protein n=1 Tax=Exocentrus adspersus TaxID=1586481 RepID=A0AAV8VUM3_9CUCU|nr:hypothetical protein NQ315_000054 [Exocentrus adspersus]